MSQTVTTLRLADLIGSRVVTAAGQRLGHVVEIEVSLGPEYRVLALLLGRSGWLDRFGLWRPKRSRGRRRQVIPWLAVERFERCTITLRPDADELISSTD